MYMHDGESVSNCVVFELVKYATNWVLRTCCKVVPSVDFS